MKILVTGANGMLGQDLCPILEDEGYEVVETDISSLDITDGKNVESVFSKENPKIVIHCAAYTNVDKAEENLEMARLINSKGTENIARACKKFSAMMVYISTDYVFDGKRDKPYLPTDETEPLNNYGITKLEGENIVREILDNYYICRTSWLYGIHGNNFVEKMLALAGAEPELSCESKTSRAEIKVVDDQIGCPTWTVELSNGIIKLLADNAEFGTYHICGSGQTSWYGFAKEIFAQTGLEVNLTPCSTEEFVRPANRPKYSVMENNKICRDWKVALKEYLALRPD